MILFRTATNIFLSASLMALFACTPIKPVLTSKLPLGNSEQGEATQAKPRDREFDWMSNSAWYHKHADHVAIAAQGQAEVVFLGDSITESWAWGDGQTDVFKRYFGDYETANFGIGGDQTQNLLWRLQNGLKGRLDPKVVVLLIGVNNFGHSNHSAQAVFAGVQAVVRQAEKNYPNARILLNAIFPYDQTASSPNRQRLYETNTLIAQLGGQGKVTFYDFGGLFLDQNNDIPQALMADYLHPTPAGLELFAQKIAPIVKNWIAEANRLNTWVPIGDPHVQIMGRTAVDANDALLMGYPGVTINLSVKAKKLVLAAASSGESYFDLLLDGIPKEILKLDTSARKITLFANDEAVTHSVSLVHRSETWHGITSFTGFYLSEGELLDPPPLPSRRLLVIGDSVACGEAIDRVVPANPKTCKKGKHWWNARESFGMVLGQKLNAQTHLVCYGGRGLVRSWNGKTNEQNVPDFYPLAIADPSRRYLWESKNYPADAILVEVGTNDFSASAGAIPAKKHYVDAYVKFVNTLLRDHPNAQIVLTEGAILQDDDTRKSKSVLQEYLYNTQHRVASDQVHVIPSHPYPGDACDGHPTKQGHANTAADFELPLRTILGWKN